MGDRKIDARTFDFALLVVDAYKFLLGKKEFVLSKQFLRAGTSIGANVTESQAAQSRNDFISKMAIASKEARETLYWIRLLKRSGFFQGICKSKYPGRRDFLNHKYSHENRENHKGTATEGKTLKL